MSNVTETIEHIEKPPKLTYEDVIKDLCSIPINQKDVLFERNDLNNEKSTKDSELFDKIEKYVLLNTELELENENEDSDLSTKKLEKNFEKIEEKLQKLQNFIDISEKFLAISNKQA